MTGAFTVADRNDSTTVDISLQEAWSNAPTGKKRETTHVVRCETEIFRIARS
jgi:hypothetical protein